MARTQLNIRIPAGDLIRWRQQAQEEQRSLTELIARAVDQYLQRDAVLQEHIRENLERRDKRRKKPTGESK